MSGNTGALARWSWILLSLAVLAGVVVYLDSAQDTIDVQQSAAEVPPPAVTVAVIPVGPETVEVAAFAEVRPRWSAELRSAVSGRVLKVHESALAGERVSTDTPLIAIEDSQYVAERATAELSLKEARLALLKAEKATDVARRQFQQAGTQPPNDLALHLPQLRIAQATVKAATARVAASKQQLRDTLVTAPFSGFVVERFVSPGQSLNIGDPLVKLVDDRHYDLVAEIGRADWSLLHRPLPGLIARVINQEGELIARANVRRAGGFLDEKTRQYKIFLEIREPANDEVLSGDFVRVLLPGVRVQAALNLPESALTQEGYIWHVDEENTLRRETPHVLFRRHDRIIVRAWQDADTLRIAVTPLVSFLPGQRVRPELVEN